MGARDCVTYSSALPSQSGRLRGALVTLQLKQRYIISLPGRLGWKVILGV